MANVNVTYQEMRDAANRFSQAKTELENQLSALKSMVGNLVNNGYVTDKSSKKFDESYQEFNEGAQQMAEGMQGMGDYLKAAADAFEQADEELAKALNK